MAEKMIVIKASDMEEGELKRLNDAAYNAMKEAVKESRQERVIARYIKKEFDRERDLGWNCVVGRNFGAHVVHQTKKYVYFQVKELSILLWKS